MLYSSRDQLCCIFRTHTALKQTQLQLQTLQASAAQQQEDSRLAANEAMQKEMELLDAVAYEKVLLLFIVSLWGLSTGFCNAVGCS